MSRQEQVNKLCYNLHFLCGGHDEFSIHTMNDAFSQGYLIINKDLYPCIIPTELGIQAAQEHYRKEEESPNSQPTTP